MVSTTGNISPQNTTNSKMITNNTLYNLNFASNSAVFESRIVSSTVSVATTVPTTTLVTPMLTNDNTNFIKRGNTSLIHAQNIISSEEMFSGTPTTTELCSTSKDTDSFFMKHLIEMSMTHNESSTATYLTSSSRINIISNNANANVKDISSYASNAMPIVSTSKIFEDDKLTYSHISSDSVPSMHISREFEILKSSMSPANDSDSTQRVFGKPTNQCDAGTTEILLSSGIPHSHEAHLSKTTKSFLIHLPECTGQAITATDGFTAKDESILAFSKFISSKALFLGIASSSTMVTIPVSLSYRITSTDELQTSRSSLPPNHVSQISTHFRNEIKSFTKPTSPETETGNKDTIFALFLF